MASANDNKRLTSRYYFTKSWHSVIELLPGSQVLCILCCLISLWPISCQWCDLYLKFYRRPTSLCLHPAKPGLVFLSVSVTTGWHLLRTIQCLFQQNSQNYKSNFTFYVRYRIFRSNKTCYVPRKKGFWGCVEAAKWKNSFVIASSAFQSFPLPGFTEMKQGA